MSTLEKAYLKAMQEEGQEQDPFDSSNVVVKRKDARELSNSRDGIKRMEQRHIYTAEERKNKKLISSSMKEVRLLDSYRNLRTKLLNSSDKQNFITMVTSVVPDDDSSLVAANLAATFALDEGKTATLIDTKIHNPSLDALLDLEGKPGLIDFLESQDFTVKDVLHHTGIPRLRLVPCGEVRESASEYFTSDKMREFIEELLGRYPDRFPIIDAPCITHSADTRILTELCDKVVLVIPYGGCSEDDIMKAVLAIGKTKLAGVILNQF